MNVPVDVLRLAWWCGRAMWWLPYVCTCAETFLYVGPDEDAFSLNLLQAHEDRILFVEPLVAWSNKGRIQDAVLRPPSDRQNVDRLFECEIRPAHVDPRFTVCAYPLTMQLVKEYVETFTRNLKASSDCESPDPNGLWRLHIISSNATLGRFDMTFISDGVLRSLSIVFQRIQDVDLSAELHNEQVSTLSFIGVGPNAFPAISQLCRMKRFGSRVRLIGGNRVRHIPPNFTAAKNPSCCKNASSLSSSLCCKPASLHKNCDAHMDILTPFIASTSYYGDPEQLCLGSHAWRSSRENR